MMEEIALTETWITAATESFDSDASDVAELQVSAVTGLHKQRHESQAAS